MQNIDFRTQTRQKAFVSAKQAGNSVSSAEPQSRRFSFVFAGMVLFFTMGLFAGIKIGKLQKIEKADCIVRYPDERRTRHNTKNIPVQKEKVQTSLANTGKKLTYIVKVGEFDTKTARRLSRQINSLPELRKLRPLPCKGVQESGNRPPAFRMKPEPASARENVLVGCFQNAARANHILNTIKRSGLPGSSRAKLYEY